MTLIASPTGEGLLTNYDELVAAIVSWLHRKDLADRVPTFIALAEVRINRIAQVRAMESDMPLQLEVGQRVIELPANFSAPLGVWLADVQPREGLTSTLAEQLPVTTTPGRPACWAIDGQALAFNCPADAPYPFVLRQRGGFKLGPANPTNALLTQHPDLYLYGALLQSAPYLRDIESKMLWQEQYNEAVREVAKSESRARAAVPLRTELAGLLGRNNLE